MTAPPPAALVLVAAGVGSRMAGPVHKALLEIDGRSLVEHALATFLPCAWLDPVVLVGHRDDRPALEDLCARQPRPVVHVDGGARRQDSVTAGVAAAGAAGDGPDVVLVHDVARPFPPLDRLPALADAAREAGASLLAVPVADTLKEVPAGDAPGGGAGPVVGRTVPREGLWAAQTPQAFRRAELLELLGRAEQAGTTVTDEAGLFEAAGRAVRIVEGSRLGFKVTHPADLELADAVARARRSAAGAVADDVSRRADDPGDRS